MSRKQIAKVSKESASWHKRYDKVNAALIVTKQNEEDLKRKNAALEKLCRALRGSTKNNEEATASASTLSTAVPTDDGATPQTDQNLIP